MQYILSSVAADGNMGMSGPRANAKIRLPAMAEIGSLWGRFASDGAR
jgi:hypothetical protein